MEFWKNRIVPKNPGLVNEIKYASALVRRFHLSGEMNDVVTADSILYTYDKAFNHNEPAPEMALVRNSIFNLVLKMQILYWKLPKLPDLNLMNLLPQVLM